MIAIAAMAKNRVIGNGDKMPWHSKEDFKFFREVTIGRRLIMGRKTYEGLPGPLKGRTIWVLSSEKNYEDIRRSPEGYIEGVLYFNEPKNVPEDAVICGGASIYKLFLPYCSEFYLTEFDFEAEGDVTMPNFDGLFRKKELIREITNARIYKYSI